MSAATPDLSSLRIERAETSYTSRRRRWPWLTAGIVLALAIVGFIARPREPEVQVASATIAGGSSTSADGISANGYIVARTKASVAAKIPGRLEYLGVDEGSGVQRGQIIARLESADQQALLAAAKASLGQVEAELEQAQRDFVRAHSLAARQVLSPADLENAQTRVGVLEAQARAARAQVRLAQVNLGNTRVRAPFDGTVLRKDAEVGEIVAPASAGGAFTRTAIVTMADLATLEVEVDVNEAYIARIRNGQPTRITLDAYPDTSFTGRVRQVVPTADRQKATVLVKVAILDRDARILPEMGAKVVFVRNEAAAKAAPRRVTVPADAVVSEDGNTRVWVVEGGRLKSLDVTLGSARGEDVEVTDGLAGGEQVVRNPSAALRDGGRVRVASARS